MELATRTEVLTLELTACSPSLFSYAEKQLLKSGEPDVIQRLVERKLRRLRWNAMGAIALVLVYLVQAIGVGIGTGRWEGTIASSLWVVVFAIYTEKVFSSRASMREAGERLVSHLEHQRTASPRAG